ncbi:MFS transporter [Bacillus sp. SD075]|uniref:MFS transporter n=1 Tax=Bacillus sp. SD075 TaxID=2781732 RepID=UPI001A96E71D|nr:MFS transporter [Bacillus sp. SD075]MBO0997545.1 MFS transporter [Bacillus sp. SD075]
METPLIKEKTTVILSKDHFNFLASIFCFWFAFYIYAPVFGIYLQSIGFTFSAIGIIFGSYGITQILLRFPLGVLSDFLQDIRKLLLVAGFIAALLSNLILVYFESFFYVLTARLLVGITASMWVMATVLYSQYFTADQAPKAMGIIQFITVATQFISMGISGWLVHHFGWDFPFWVGAVASILGIYFALNIKEVKHNPISMPEKPVDYFKKTIKIPQLKMLTLLSLIAHAVLFITIFGFSPMHAAELGMKEQSLFWLTSAFFIPHSLASLSFVFFKLDRHYNKIVLAICFFLSACSLIAIPLTESIFHFNLMHILIGLFLGFIFPILLGEVIHVSPTEYKMSAMGFFQSFYAMGIFLGPLIAGVITENSSLGTVFVFTGGLALFAAVLVLLFSRAKVDNSDA